MANKLHCDRCQAFGAIGVTSSVEKISVPPDGRYHFMLTISATLIAGKKEDGSLELSDRLDLCESCWRQVAALRHEGF